ncbi:MULTISPECIES: 30S ribosomal protein S11 [Campylobacter]|mgnify:FL=1|jgi:small subunit ribosomal protein S11|uniref:Small ribosomal subunit protein uS11 n=1 Tax=Campylobacter vicugnae TaxID=1660076 RepID=A0A1X9SZ02_9BACT|nr:MULTISPECIES: 30S ribosomal protein S11 [Campylobacter]MCR8690734.1 30S ribosomal protein S11 [Campylobacter sp. RM9264]MCR8701623.1 30S ribosomal protein S11 [Campylobacter sp. RM12176]ARR01522.1 30S ribosomal protein S11 [Campylobacter sp. RM8964]ARR03244.1 30S ribosomal protein S11 [Campylobacter sp. RM12175]MBE6430560.1 30S ribosomal protein S11 [Campylobacter sp.]
MAKRKVIKKKVVKKNIARGIVYVSATFNNTMVTVTDEMGNAIAWSSAGGLGFKGSKKSTPYAAQQAVEDALSKAKEHGIKEVGIKVQGPGSGRETAVKSIGAVEGIKVLYLKDITPLAHNGCRPPKRRRV